MCMMMTFIDWDTTVLVMIMLVWLILVRYAYLKCLR